MTAHLYANLVLVVLRLTLIVPTLTLLLAMSSSRSDGIDVAIKLFREFKLSPSVPTLPTFGIVVLTKLY